MRSCIQRDNEYLRFLYEKIIDILCVLCLTGTLLYLCETQNVLYQSNKNVSASKAILLFTVFLFITQRVRLFNRQSLIATLLYLPAGYAYAVRYAESATLFERDRIVVLIVWFAIMIAVDMAVYHKRNSLHRFRFQSLMVFGFMTLAMTFYRNDRTYPVIFILAFLFYLIPLDGQGWQRLINQFCTTWLVTFFIILYRSWKNNPEVDTIEGAGRWYGDFLNIGHFGLFIACVVVVILYKLHQSGKRYGRLSIPYAFYVICLLPILWTVFRVSTVTMFIGIAFVFLMYFILLGGKCTVQKVLRRFIFAALFLFFLLIIGYAVLMGLSHTDADYWKTIMLEGNVFIKPVANLIYRAHYMFDETRTFADSEIFRPGSFINYVDLFTSGRLSLIKVFAEHFSFTGGPSEGYQVGTYYAYSAHNAYTQVIYEYGYLGGGAFILWLFYSVIAGVRQYIREQKTTQFLICIWMAMTLGVLLGEVINLYTPTIFMTLFVTYPLMIDLDKKNTAD